MLGISSFLFSMPHFSLLSLHGWQWLRYSISHYQHFVKQNWHMRYSSVLTMVLELASQFKENSLQLTMCWWWHLIWVISIGHIIQLLSGLFCPQVSSLFHKSFMSINVEEIIDSIIGKSLASCSLESPLS